MLHPRLTVPARHLFTALLACAGLWAAAGAEANVSIDISGVDDTMRDNVLAHLSLARYKDRELDADTLERLHNRVEREVRDALRPFGYYDPTVTSRLDAPDAKNSHLTIAITPGEPVLLDRVSVIVTGPGERDPLFERVITSSTLRLGDQLNHAKYEQVKTDLQRTAATYGYLDAKLTRSELRVDPVRHIAEVDLALQSGERYRFGPTTIDQEVIREKLVRKYLRYHERDPFDVTQLLRTQFALDDSQYFATLEVLPGEPDRQAHVVPINIHAAPNRRSRYSFGAGYGSDTGLRGTARWDNRRVNRRGHRFNVELEAAQTAKSLETRYIVPMGDPALEKFTFEVAGEQRELADLDTDTVSIEPSVTRVLGSWQRVLFVTATHTVTKSPIERLDDNLLIPGVSFASLPQGYLGEPLFNRGVYAELRGSHSVLGSDSNFLQLHVTAERAFTIVPLWHLILRNEFGTSLVSRFSELPGSVRFFAGGDNSVRGFGYNELGPVEKVVDANGNIQRVKVGGRHLITGTFEVERDLPRNFGIAAFFDFGNAFDKFGKPPDPDDRNFLEYSVGLGFRLRLPVVTVGIDIAQPLSEHGAGPRLHINFSPKL